ncbi:MAG: hypothetical protein ACOC33_02665 [bacterium]
MTIFYGTIEEVASFKYRTFTIIKDGIVNVGKLPISGTKQTRTLLEGKDVKYTLSDDYDAKYGEDRVKTLVLDLTSLPIINRKMVQSISANELAKQEWELAKLQGESKVYKYYRNDLFPKKSEKFADLLGDEAAEWLKEIGVTDYNGFAPKTTTEESVDSYMAVSLKTKIKGLSSLPKVEVVETKIKDGKPLKINEWVMAEPIKKYQEQLDSDMFKSLDEDKQKDILNNYLVKKTEQLNWARRKVLQKVAEIKFSLILSKMWFNEFKSFDENKLELELDGQKVQFTFDMSENEVKI